MEVVIMKNVIVKKRHLKNKVANSINHLFALALFTSAISQPLLAMGATSDIGDVKKAAEKRRLTDSEQEENAHKRIKTPDTDIKTPTPDIDSQANKTVTPPQPAQPMIDRAAAATNTVDHKEAKAPITNGVIPTCITHPEKAFELCEQLNERYTTCCSTEKGELSADKKDAIIQTVAGEILPDVLLAQPDPNSAQSPYNQALHVAAAIDNLVIVKILLTAGIDINCLDELGHSAFWYTLPCNSINVMTYLLMQHAAMAGVTLSIL
jgi:hypothetical protein